MATSVPLGGPETGSDGVGGKDFRNISILVLIAVTLCLEYEIQVFCPNCKWWPVKLVLEFPLRQQSSSVVNPSRFCIYSFIISLLRIRVTRLMQTRFLALEVPRP